MTQGVGGWWRRRSPAFIVWLAVLVNLMAAVVLARLGFYVFDLHADWFDRFWAAAVPTMGGALALGGLAIKWAFRSDPVRAELAEAPAPEPRPAAPPALAAPEAGPVVPSPGAALDARRLVDDYLEHQHSAAQTLRIGDIFDPDLLPDCTEVRLADVYVPLEVAEVAPERVNEPAFRRLSFLHAGEPAVPLVQALADAIVKAPAGLRAVLIGEAGSGKSSAVGELLHRCRPGAPPIDGWPAVLADRHLLRFDLRRLGAGCAAEPATDTDAAGRTGDPDALRAFWQAVRADLCEGLPTRLDPARDRDRPEVVAAAALLCERLREKGLLLLDGLDEVLDPGRRRQVRALVETLGRDLGRGCALLVTARPYVYPDAALRGFAVWRLQPLRVDGAGGPGQASDLIANWYRALGQGEGAARTLAAALAADPGRADLATRPLLLTLLIALSLARRGQGASALPTGRAGLIAEATTLFVKRWFDRINLIGTQISPELRAALTPERLHAVLRQVSIEARPEAADQGAADAARAEVTVAAEHFQRTLLGVLPDHLSIRISRVAEAQVLDRAGLLFPRGPDSYGFVHRLFQEYLAACELIDPHPPRPGRPPWPPLDERLAGLLRADPAAWREVTRFAAVGLLHRGGGTGGAAAAVHLVRALLEGAAAPAAGERDYEVALAAGLAFEDLSAALADLHLSPAEQADLADAGRRLDAWFLRLVDDPAPSPLTRRDFGRLIGRLGREPRPGIVPSAWTPDPGAPFALDLARDFDWVAIGAGPFTPGSGPDDDLAYASERGGTLVELPAFSITRYPVSCAQFAAFTRAGGYGGGATPPPWWREVSEAAVEWWHGGNPGLEQALADPDWSDDYKEGWKDWFARRGPEARRRPWFEGDPQYADWLLPNHPVIGVSWFEAMAFCRWLSGLDQARSHGWVFRLPSEIEWERAARGPRGHRWPWGNDWRDDACNGGAARLGSTSAVGVFPYPSAEGLRDLAGNVYEWTLTRWGPKVGTPAFGWPLVPGDGRDDPGGADLRVTRGGSWYGEPKDTPRWCRGAYRDGGYPGDWSSFQGVRVLRVSLAVSVS